MRSFTTCFELTCFFSPLKRQKEDQEELLYTIFPRTIAKDLIKRGGANFDVTKGSFTETLGRTVARMHESVTVLFTDIVGFTAMSQQSLPYEVMMFLHELFTAFDDYVEINDGHLWKVETGELDFKVSFLVLSSERFYFPFSFQLAMPSWWPLDWDTRTRGRPGSRWSSCPLTSGLPSI